MNEEREKTIVTENEERRICCEEKKMTNVTVARVTGREKESTKSGNKEHTLVKYLTELSFHW